LARLVREASQIEEEAADRTVAAESRLETRFETFVLIRSKSTYCSWRGRDYAPSSLIHGAGDTQVQRQACDVVASFFRGRGGGSNGRGRIPPRDAFRDVRTHPIVDDMCTRKSAPGTKSTYCSWRGRDYAPSSLIHGAGDTQVQRRIPPRDAFRDVRTHPIVDDMCTRTGSAGVPAPRLFDSLP
jgi:hypothetical protein